MCDEFNLSKEMPFLLQPFVEIADRRLTFLMFFGYGALPSPHAKPKPRHS